jgi:hypothetical protein
MLTETIRDWLVTFTRPGLGRDLVLLCARYSARVCDWLWMLDIYYALSCDNTPGTYILEWPVGRPHTQMVEILAERIRRAPRPLGIRAFRLEIGHRGDPAPAGELEGVWDENTRSRLETFLAQHANALPQAIQLFLVGELVAAVNQHYRWKFVPLRAQ